MDRLINDHLLGKLQARKGPAIPLYLYVVDVRHSASPSWSPCFSDGDHFSNDTTRICHSVGFVRWQCIRY